MNLKGLGEETVNHGLFGGNERAQNHQRHNIDLSNVNGNYNCELEILDEKKICSSLPRMNDDNCLKQLKDLCILTSDAMINEKFCLFAKTSGEINWLNGADYAGKLLTGNVKHLSGCLVAVHTHLGWTVMGKSDIKAPLTSS
ncbi:integrase catalytic domain-containing protein [Nephila pilipes]|uniref:Integrase catalytic domain-containing protein n=1 Tax=Nephila pilipes TaxID=299642 RepID=A0A8X6T7H2_NEPPI|nr:integrase catalytic domain-containing protein [Nephila pilipes]